MDPTASELLSFTQKFFLPPQRISTESTWEKFSLENYLAVGGGGGGFRDSLLKGWDRVEQEHFHVLLSNSSCLIPVSFLIVFFFGAGSVLVLDLPRVTDSWR